MDSICVVYDEVGLKYSIKCTWYNALLSSYLTGLESERITQMSVQPFRIQRAAHIDLCF